MYKNCSEIFGNYKHQYEKSTRKAIVIGAIKPKECAVKGWKARDE